MSPRWRWWVHNLVAHPLLVLWPRVGDRLHWLTAPASETEDAWDAPRPLWPERVRQNWRLIRRDWRRWCVPDEALRLGPLTLGGYRWMGQVWHPDRDRGERLVAPVWSGPVITGIDPPRWEQWSRWWPPAPRLTDLLPRFSADRGPIRFHPAGGVTVGVDTTAQRRGTTLSPAELFVLDQWGRQLAEAFGATPYLVGSAERGGNWRDVDVRMVLPWPEETMSALAVYTLNVAISLWGRQVTGLPIDFQMQGEAAFHSYDDETRNPLGGRARSGYRGVTEFALGLPSEKGRADAIG